MTGTSRSPDPPVNKREMRLGLWVNLDDVKVLQALTHAQRQRRPPEDALEAADKIVVGEVGEIHRDEDHLVGLTDGDLGAVDLDHLGAKAGAL